MNPKHDERDVRMLTRAKWVGVLLPIAAIWLFELFRYTAIDPTVPADSAHLFSALVMSGGAVVFGLGIFAVLDRAQRRLVDRNQDLAATHAVASALQEGAELPAMLATALDLVLAHSGALAGAVRLDRPGATPLMVRRPAGLGPGLQWVESILDEIPSGISTPNHSTLGRIDAGVVDLPLASAAPRTGAMRLLFHPAGDPAISIAALADLAEKIGTTASLSTTLADLRREEHERSALYAVALQLTGRAELRELLETITRHARELLGAERSVACLADPRLDGRSYDWTDRLALADDGSTCLLAHPDAHAGHGDATHNPACPLHRVGPPAIVLARPMRGADGFLGELCVARTNGIAFTDRERDLLGALADMAAVAVGTARLREAEQQLTIVAERDRIARELHDSLAQVLGVIHLRLRSLEPEVADTPGNGVAAEIGELAEIADEAYKDVREAILGLRESITAVDGLEGALGEYLRKYTRQTGIKATLLCDGSARRALNPRSEVQLLRVVQEALTNVRKHAEAARVTVTLRAADGVVLLVVMDDGKGFDPSRLEEALDHGFGLASMRERVEQVGGTLAVHTAPGKGTRVEVRLQQEETRAAHAPDAARAAG